MAITDSTPVTWTPTGLTDSADGTNVFRGAMLNLQNLVMQPNNRGCWVPRPAAVSQTDFASFTSPAQGTALFILGNIAYGMIASGHFAGHDEPFAFNLLTQTFETISGVTSANTPTTQATTGDWTPPTMDLIGARV